MREELACALNGQDFCSLDPRLYLQDIAEQVRARVDTVAMPGGSLRPVGGGRESLTVTLRFMVKERDRAERQRVIDRVNAWAGAGWLTVSTRPEKRLYVQCTQPAGTAAWKWSGDTQVTFQAYAGACWQERYPVSGTAAGAEGAVTLRPLGTRPCKLEAEITNASDGLVNAVTLHANGKCMAFAGLNLAPGEALKLYYDAQGVLRADGKLACRTAESADDLPLYPGQSNTVQFQADGVCDVRLHARGEWA